MGSFFPFVKKWVLPVSADLEDRKKKKRNFCRIFMWDITLGHHPPTLGRGGGGHYYRNNQAIHSVGYLSITDPPAGQCLALYHLVRAGRSPSQYARVYLWAATVTTNGFSCRKGCSTEEEKKKKKKKICNNLFIVRPGVCYFYQFVDLIAIFSFFFSFLRRSQCSHTRGEFVNFVRNSHNEKK
jgi:hypothetical protein